MVARRQAVMSPACFYLYRQHLLSIQPCHPIGTPSVSEIFTDFHRKNAVKNCIYWIFKRFACELYSYFVRRDRIGLIVLQVTRLTLFRGAATCRYGSAKIGRAHV